MSDGASNYFESKSGKSAGPPSPEELTTWKQAIRIIQPQDSSATLWLNGPDPRDPPRPPKATSTPTDEDPFSPFPSVGGKLLHFHVEEELGRGAFARVYLARQESLANRLVVLKVTTVGNDEPQTLARLRHTNIVPVYSVHQSGTVQIVCMPYLGRLTLGQVMLSMLTWSQMPPDRGATLLNPLGGIFPSHELQRLSYVEGCLWVVGQLAAGLAHAHSRGVLHQDLKPANVLFTEDGVPMILDFNVASDGTGHAHDSRVGGTLPYMAPERLRQFLDEVVDVDERSDLFSLGVILYQLLTGQLPFPINNLPDRDETLRRMLKQRQEECVPLRNFNPAVTPAVQAIVNKLLVADPRTRYRSADELREDISQQLLHQPLCHAVDRSPGERFTKWRRRNPLLATSVAVAIAVFLSLILPVGLFAEREARALARAEEELRAESAFAADRAVADLHTAAIELGADVDPAMRRQGLRATQELMDQYGVANPNWKNQPRFVLLDAQRQAQLSTAFAEVLLLLSQVDGSVSGFAPDMEEQVEPRGRPLLLHRHARELRTRREGRSVPGESKEAGFSFDGLDLTATGRTRQERTSRSASKSVDSEASTQAKP